MDTWVCCSVLLGALCEEYIGVPFLKTGLSKLSINDQIGNIVGFLEHLWSLVHVLSFFIILFYFFTTLYKWKTFFLAYEPRSEDPCSKIYI